MSYQPPTFILFVYLRKDYTIKLYVVCWVILNNIWVVNIRIQILFSVQRYPPGTLFAYLFYGFFDFIEIAIKKKWSLKSHWNVVWLDKKPCPFFLFLFFYMRTHQGLLFVIEGSSDVIYLICCVCCGVSYCWFSKITAMLRFIKFKQHFFFFVM